MEKKIGESIQNSSGVFKGTRDVAVGIVEAVSDTTVKVLEGVKDIETSLGAIIGGAIKVAGDTGADLTS